MNGHYKKIGVCTGCAVGVGIALLSGLFAQSFDGQFMPPRPPDASFPGGMPPDGPMSDVVPDLAGVITADGSVNKTTAPVVSKTVASDTGGVSVLLACNGGTLEASGSSLIKKGNTGSMNQSNFYGLNAVAVASAGSTLSLNDCTVESSAEGANGIFSTGSGASITVKKTIIKTHGNSSRGLDATYGGSVTAETVSITTDGAHCAALATDRGEGTITVHGGTAMTAGDGSPVIYSTGTICADDLTGKASGAEIAAIEGKNTITIRNCDLTGSGDHGIMLYQSFSGDAGVGTSVFTAQDCRLTSVSAGPFFYITNTAARIELSRSVLTWPSGPLINVAGNDGRRGWGRSGENGGTLLFSAHDQVLRGDIVCDTISSVDFSLGSAASYTGAINCAAQGQVNVTLDAGASWTVTGDSHVAVLQDTDTAFGNIMSGGFTVYYNSRLSENAKLGGKVYDLAGGGKLAPEV